MKRKKIFSFVSLAIVAVGCSENEIRVSYDDIGGASALLGEVRSACDLALTAEQAGRYEVTSLTGVYEEYPADSGQWEPHTYIELKLVERWTGSASDVTVRVGGGPFPDGSTAAQFIEVRRGETIGAILNSPHAWNANYHFLEIQQLFREDAGQMSNGYLRDSASQLADVVGTAIDDGECTNDITYQRVQPPTPGPVEHRNGS